MSDFVGRIAARAVGDAVLAQPRVRGLFEDQSAPGAGLEVLDEEISAPARPRPAPKAPAPTAEGSTVPALPPEAPAPRRRDARTRAPAERLTPARPQRSEARAASPEPPHSTDSERERRSEPAVRARVALSPPPARAVRVEPPVVRVHIGRLEVRANVHEPAREERVAEPQPQGLTLSEYLRGRRESA
jgi:hypothetical protein